MHRTLEYTILFVVLGLLQTFLFNGLGISVYVNPLVYIAFIILLPIEISGAVMLAIAFALGVTMDFFMGMAGINTIATVFTAFCRPLILNVILGKDVVNDGGVPNTNTLGRAKFIQYALILIIIQCATFFFLEALTWSNFHITLLRITLSTVVTFVLVYLCQKLFAVNRQKI